MAYCRWSSDDYQCDVYCYEDVSESWITHVANRRYVFKEPLPPPVDFDKNPEGWFARHKQIRSLLDGSTMVEILLPYAGETFEDASLADMIVTLQRLKDTGYRIPDWVFEDMRQELQQALNDGESS